MNLHTPAVEREPPSLPASPSPKRIKHIEPAANLSVASILNDPAATPTPESPPHKHQKPDMSASATHLPPMNLEPPPPALQIKLLSATARAPTRGSAFAAGYDLYASKST
ncbi:hypothetical protein KCU78_g8529, partial [Aureobasidium melanogenum]